MVISSTHYPSNDYIISFPKLNIVFFLLYKKRNDTFLR